MRRSPTALAARVWRHLSNSQLGHKFRRPHVIFAYICDFFCPSNGLVVEIDRDSHDAPYDERRDARLAAKGFETLRFTNHQVSDNLDGVILTIADVLRHRSDRWSGVGPVPESNSEAKDL